jgi:hypothetical protein
MTSRFGNLAGFHSATWRDFIRQLGRIQFPFFSHFAMASRNLGTTAWSFTGPMPGMPSASVGDFGRIEARQFDFS